jgi:hypothetical protein
MSDIDAVPSELHEAARQFHNLTIGDSTVIIRPWTAEKRDAIVAAGERLRAALTIAAPEVQADHIVDCKMVAGEVSEADVIQTCEVHGFPLDPEQLEVVTAVVNQILLSASKPDAQNDGRCPHCHAISHYVECPSCGMDSDAAAPAQSGEPVASAGVAKARELLSALIPMTDNSDSPVRNFHETLKAIREALAAPQPSQTAVVLDDERKLDVSVLARLSAQIFDCPLNPTISKFAHAVEANARAASPQATAKTMNEIWDDALEHIKTDPALLERLRQAAMQSTAAQPAQTGRDLTDWERKCLTFAGQHLLHDGFIKEADTILNLCAQPASGGES